MSYRAVLAGFLWLLAATAAALPSQAPQPRFAPDPPGVHLRPAVSPESVETASDGVKWLVVADQVRLDEPQPRWFREIRYQVVEERGLEGAGQFNIHFQPAYQRVEIHAIDIEREGRVQDRRSTARIEVLRREEDLEAGLIDGSLTANITLPDLRVGDTVAYRFSVIGANPVFGNAYYDSYAARYGVPLGVRALDVWYPANRPLRWRAPPVLKATVREDAGQQHVSLLAERLPAVVEEAGIPTSFDPFGVVELSTASSWADVSAWALPLYPRRFADPAAVAPLVRRLRLDRADPVGSALRATAFVQGEVRYTGLDMGTNSHAPNRPELVLERRFGDCKDKTTLLIALLAEAGVPADPVLVNTDLRESLRERLPGANVFDHVIVRARLEGRDVWIDPTLARERGDFASRQVLDYGYGLPIAAGSRDLVRMPAARPAQPQVDVEQTIVLSREGEQAHAEFEVASEYRQAFAEDVRGNFSSRGPVEQGKLYLNYMQEYYEGLRAKGEPVGRDADTTYQVKEKYGLNWNTADQGTAFGIVVFQLLDWLPTIADQERTMPLGLTGPRHGRHTIRTRLDSGWSIKPRRDEVENAYFRVVRQVRVEGEDLVISADWYRDADVVPAKDVAALRKDVAKVRKLLQFDVDIAPNEAPLDFRWRDLLWPVLSLPAALVLLLVAAWQRKTAWGGSFYRPYASVSEQLAAGGIGVTGLIGVLLSIGTDSAFELAQRLPTWQGAAVVGGIVGVFVGLSLRWAIWVGVQKLALRLLGHRVDFGVLWRGSGLAALPFCLLAGVAILAMGFDFGLMAEDGGDLSGGQLLALLAALFWMLVGGIWWLVAQVNVTAAIARISRGRAVAALAITVGMILAVVLPLVLIYFIAKG